MFYQLIFSNIIIIIYQYQHTLPQSLIYII